jgi:hypothetical protein
MREHVRAGTDPAEIPATEVLREENPLESPAEEQFDDDVLDPELDDEEELRRERDPLSG